jgi:hypothetical protein
MKNELSPRAAHRHRTAVSLTVPPSPHVPHGSSAPLHRVIHLETTLHLYTYLQAADTPATGMDHAFSRCAGHEPQLTRR